MWTNTHPRNFSEARTGNGMSDSVAAKVDTHGLSNLQDPPDAIAFREKRLPPISVLVVFAGRHTLLWLSGSNLGFADSGYEVCKIGAFKVKSYGIKVHPLV